MCRSTSVLAAAAALILILFVVAGRCVGAVRSMWVLVNLPNMASVRRRQPNDVTTVETRYADKRGLTAGQRLSVRRNYAPMW